MEDIGFAYPGRTQPVIDGISITVEAGQVVAFVSKTGGGKTTLFKLISRMYDVGQGRITLDGTDIRCLEKGWYHRLFALVSQNVAVFEGTIRHNITYGFPDATEEQISEAVRVAHLDQLLENKDKFEHGLETRVGEKEKRLSGGEAQRVGIARAYLAVLGGAKFLMLDEATSHLDSETEHYFQQALHEMIDKLRKSQTVSVLIIAHRLSTVRKADMIYVLKDGKIIEQGTDRNLQLQNGLYARLKELQENRQFDLSQ